MLKKLINSLVKPFGYEVRKASSNITTREGFELYGYTKPDGTFDYETYKQVQVAGNLKKLDDVWVREENIAFLSEYIKKTVGEVGFGICHGTRRGKEQEWFSKHLGCEAIGTEISDSAEQFPNTIQWDFHEVKPEWIGAVDFIYSNSFDHTYDPEKCLNAWMSCLKQGGVCILEHSSGHEQAHELDPFGAHVARMPYLILTWGKGKYFVREILDAPSKKSSLKYMKYIVLYRS
jgi:hypothetical protein